MKGLEKKILRKYIGINKEVFKLKIDLDNEDTKNYIGNEGSYVELRETYIDEINQKQFFLNEIDKILGL